MITTGSKFLIGSAVLAAVAAILYGVTQDGVMGTVGLATAAVALTLLAVVNTMARDSNVFTDDGVPVETVAAAQPSPLGGVWPFAFALSGVIIAVGLVTQQTIVVIGLAALAATGAEWVVSNWADRASADRRHNASVRSRLSNPLEFPLGGAVAIGVVIFAFSRVMLWFSKVNTVIAFSILALVVLGIAFVFANRPSVKTGAIGGTAVVGAVAVVVAGTAAGLDGERDIRVFETTSLWQQEAIAHPEEYAEGAEEGKHPAGFICESPEEFPEADEKASQTVAMKSNHFQIFLLEDGTLDFDVPGPRDEGSDVITFQRSNTTNIVFRNESDEDRRLSLDMGTEEFESEDGTTRIVPVQQCTTLIEPGAAQLLTVTPPLPSNVFADSPNPNAPSGEGGFWFFVPGVSSATLELVVP
ncbi:MAG: hypothetical protein AAF945_08670 [Actinomycetota bacterium]